MARPLLGLVMITLNEARSIAATLRSVAGVCDRFDILDTGSTDGTREIIAATAEELGMTGEIHRGEFVDFSQARNLALSIAEWGADFQLMLSGDETLEWGLALVGFLQQRQNAPEGAYAISCHLGGIDYHSTRISRAGGGWRYQGVVHEVMVGPAGEMLGAQHVVPKPCRILHDNSHRDPVKCRVGWERDKRLLAAELDKNPGDHRSQFYFAQSCSLLGEREMAIAAYQRRADMPGGFWEEEFVSLLECARNMRHAERPWPEVQAKFLEAFQRDPSRAEPLVEIGEHYYQLQQHAIAHLFFSRAARIPYPEHARLFVEPHMYKAALERLSVSSWYAGQFDEGQAAAQKCFDDASGWADERTYRNLRHYQDRKAPPRALTDDLDIPALRERLGTTKVIVSMTTIPSRWELLQKALDSIGKQRLMPDRILVCVPEVSRREGTPYVIPEWLADARAVGIEVIRTPQDYGPATKLVGCFPEVSDPDTIIVNVDDDSEYDSHLIEKLVDRALRYPKAAIGFSGINVGRLMRDGEYDLVYEQFGRRPQDPTPTNVIEAYAGVAYRRGFFGDDIHDREGFPPEAFFVDDFWFAGYLARKEIPKLVFHWSDLTLTREEVWFRLWVQHGLGNESNPLHLLPGFKNKNRVVAQAFEDRYPGIWERELARTP